MATVPANDVADLLLSFSDANAGDLMSNMKLQKLLYYTQGFHLAIHNEPLFDDRIVAWQYGPVVLSVYERFKQHGGDAIPALDHEAGINLSDQQRKLIAEVYEQYGQYSAWKLARMTHEEPPWKDTGYNEPISHDALRRYFATQVDFD